MPARPTVIAQVPATILLNFLGRFFFIFLFLILCQLNDFIIHLILSSMVGVSFTFGKGSSGIGMPRNCWQHQISLLSTFHNVLSKNIIMCCQRTLFHNRMYLQSTCNNFIFEKNLTERSPALLHLPYNICWNFPNHLDTSFIFFEQEAPWSSLNKRLLNHLKIIESSLPVLSRLQRT